jgi:hypothetical protein
MVETLVTVWNKGHPPVYPLPVYGTLFCPNQLTVFLSGTGPPSRLMFPWKYFLLYELGKKQGNQKRALYIRGGSRTRAFSWGLGTPSFGLMLSSAPCSGEHARMGTSLTTKGGTPYSSSRHLFILFTHILFTKMCNDHEKESHFISWVTKLYLINLPSPLQ